jgi:hypothetical protein
MSRTLKITNANPRYSEPNQPQVVPPPCDTNGAGVTPLAPHPPTATEFDMMIADGN